MFIVGNLFTQGKRLHVIVLSSSKLDGHEHCKKTKVVDDMMVYQYKLDIGGTTKPIRIGRKTIHIKNVKPCLNNTSVYFVSCDGQNCQKYGSSNPIAVYNASDDTDMWKKLYMDIKADRNIHKYVIHLGDQVYMDDAHDELIKNKTIDDEAVVRRTYFEAYKRNYSNRYKKKVLQSAHNVMIGDDHEFIDDYGSVPNNLTPTMLKNVKEMYNLFQEDLYGERARH